MNGETPEFLLRLMGSRPDHPDMRSQTQMRIQENSERGRRQTVKVLQEKPDFEELSILDC